MEEGGGKREEGVGSKERGVMIIDSFGLPRSARQSGRKRPVSYYLLLTTYYLLLTAYYLLLTTYYNPRSARQSGRRAPRRTRRSQAWGRSGRPGRCAAARLQARPWLAARPVRQVVISK